MCIFDNVPAPAMMLDTSLKIKGANQSMLSYHGCNTCDKVYSNLENNRSWPAILAKAYAALKGESSTMEYDFVQEGTFSLRKAKAAISPVRNTDGDIIGVSIIEKDYTWKKSLLSGLQELRNTVTQ